ncbi:GDSL-like lipase/acylhydrolase family protein [Mucilaginibacter gracilis]|uniref:GDSL-like lipase/acylhydrolase family protein n=1 Tax=Mucilaginibacter gracilis TaxID=423350 RepID=A0A495ITS8_9SPHI|nr:SGNH/GDSL hydrolase family protein [Mucilaginibacter gracilis]RKR79943.1 GDSL-like lipase/acylhydrolase family protein [Mucilaginibacter gracilis]
MKLKIISSLVLLAGMVTLLSTTLKAQTDTLDNLQEFNARKGLPNFFAKVKSGKAVSIAYLGGSITAAQGGWREQSLKWFQDQYPQAEIKHINAGVGGTGSDLGVFRVKNDVINFHPDLVFVEFAVNDGGLAPERIYQTMEGIVRQVWRADAKTDICFVYTLSGNMVPTLQAGKLWPSMLAMEHVALFYDIPSVKFGPEVISLIKDNRLIFQGKPEENLGKIVFSVDNVHPLAQTGHKIYTEVLTRSLKLIQNNTETFKHKLGKPYVADNWEEAQMISVKALTKTGDWQELTDADTVAKTFRSKFPCLIKSDNGGAAIKVRFKGRMAGIYDIMGPGSGQYSVVSDGGAPQLYTRFDKYGTYYHSNYFCLPMMPQGEHEVEFRVSTRPQDKMAILRKGNGIIGDLAKYNENSCYAGWLLLLGKLKN